MSKTTLDEFHYHEALDRAYLINCLIHDHLTEHPVIKENSVLLEQMENIENLLGDVYQMLGNLEDWNLSNKNTNNQ